MSHRTIIEINHDYIHDLMDDPTKWQNVLRMIFMNDFTGRHTEQVQGVRKVGERHHSETLTLTVE